MPDVTPDDLFGDDSGGDSGGDDGFLTGLNALVDNLDSKGYLGPLLFGPGGGRSVDEIANDEQPNVPAPEDVGDAVEAAAAGLDADTLKKFMLQVYDHAEQVPGLDDDPKLSDLIRLVDAQPDLVNMLIEQNL